MEGPWQDAQAADRLAAPRASEQVTSKAVAGAPLPTAPAEPISSNGAASATAIDDINGQGTDIVYAPIDISGFRSPMLPKLMREFSPLATVVRRPGAGETATHALDMTDRRAGEIAEQAKARSMHLVVLFEQLLPPDKASLAPQAVQSAATPSIATRSASATSSASSSGAIV